MDAAVAIAVLMAAIGVGYAMSRVARVRKELEEDLEIAKKPKRASKREKRLEQIRASEPEYVPPSIDDLIAEEMEELGAGDIPGGEGVQPGVLLKVYRRDTPATDDCAPHDRRYEIAEGVAPADAAVDDVRLVCAGHASPLSQPVDAPPPIEPPPAEK